MSNIMRGFLTWKNVNRYRSAQIMGNLQSVSLGAALAPERPPDFVVLCENPSFSI
jgi:hypothetical protein